MMSLLSFLSNRWRCIRSFLINENAKQVFTKIYKKNLWGGSESASGPGSDFIHTETLIRELSDLIKELNVSSVLDVPCGDFNWMKNVDFGFAKYFGADIVPEIIQTNIDKYATDKIAFCTLDLIKDQLPRVDMIFCRDCLVHFSFKDIELSLKNVCASGAQYFVTTTFTNRNRNIDILTGGWRPINLEVKPFFFPKPIRIISENCSQGEGKYRDKCVAVWKVSDIKEKLDLRNRTQNLLLRCI